jgi:hypothetical protein
MQSLDGLIRPRASRARPSTPSNPEAAPLGRTRRFDAYRSQCMPVDSLPSRERRAKERLAEWSAAHRDAFCDRLASVLCASQSLSWRSWAGGARLAPGLSKFSSEIFHSVHRSAVVQSFPGNSRLPVPLIRPSGRPSRPKRRYCRYVLTCIVREFSLRASARRDERSESQTAHDFGHGSSASRRR